MMRYTIAIWLLLAVGFTGCSGPALPAGQEDSCPPDTFSGIKQLFRYNADRSRPFIMAHRGGPTGGYPQNCLATFERTLAGVDCPLMEFDVRMTKDNQLVLLHDDELELCTNGEGLLSQSNWQDIRQLKLKDDDGKVTDFAIPTFEEVLTWFEQKNALLIIDGKPGTDLDLLLKAINGSKVKNQSVLICYSLANAEYVYGQTPDLMLALGFNTDPLINEIEQSSIPKDQLVALTPRELQPESYYRRIHQMGVSCSLGTNGNIDTLPLTVSEVMFRERFQTGADIICTDRPLEVAQLFK